MSKKDKKDDMCSGHEYCNCLTLCRDPQTMRDRKSFYDRKREEWEKRNPHEGLKEGIANDEYVFGPPQRDTLYDLCEQIFEAGCALADSANNADRVANLRLIEAKTNELGFDIIDYLQDLGATDFDENGEAFDAVLLPIKLDGDT